jgi:drug/metabolite transporter (DMT)-like permease
MRIVFQYLFTLALFLIAGFLEVSGDAKIREGFVDRRWILCLVGAGSLIVYGLFVNTAIALKLINWGFSKQLGVYVSIFALMSSLYGYFSFGERLGNLHLLGLSVVVVGGIIISLSK